MSSSSFSLDQVTTLPWRDASATIDSFLKETNNLYSLPPAQLEQMIKRDLKLLLERTFRACRQLAAQHQECVVAAFPPGSVSLEDNVKQAERFFAFCESPVCQQQQQSASTDNEVSFAIESFLRFMLCALDANRDALLPLLMNNGYSFLRKMKKEIFVDCLLQLPLGAESRGVGARRVAFSFLHEVAEVAEFKDFIAEEFFIPLFNFVSQPPVSIGDATDDDFPTRRVCTQILTAAIRGSKKSKQFVLQNRLLERLVPHIVDTPTGDFFFQIQCLEIVYRVTRQGTSVVKDLGLPDHLSSALTSSTSKLNDSENFVINLINILDVYNSQRASFLLQNNNNNSNHHGKSSSTNSNSNSNINIPSAICSFRVSSYEIHLEEIGNNNNNATNKKILLSKSNQEETQILFSSRMGSMLIPRMNGINHAFNLRQIGSFRISRESVVSLGFKQKLDREFTRQFFGSNDSQITNQNEWRQLQDKILSSPSSLAACFGGGASSNYNNNFNNNNSTNNTNAFYNITFSLTLDLSVAQELRSSPVQTWIKSALDKKKFYQNAYQTNLSLAASSASSNNNNTNQNQHHHQQQGSRIGSPVPFSQQQQNQNQQQQQPQFGSHRDPNAQVNNINNNNNNNNNVECQQQQQQKPSSAPQSLTNMFNGFQQQQTDNGGSSSSWFNNNNNNTQNNYQRLSVSIGNSQARAPSMMFNNNNNHNGNNQNSNMMMTMAMYENNKNRSSSSSMAGLNNNNQGSASIFAAGLQKHIEAQRQQEKKKQQDFVTQVMNEIQSRINQVRELDEQDQREYDAWVEGEVAALNNLIKNSQIRSDEAIQALSSNSNNNNNNNNTTCSRFYTASEIQSMGQQIQQELDQHKQMFEECSNSSERVYTEKTTQLKKDIETALQQCNEVVEQMCAQNVLPEEFVQKFADQ